MQVESVPPNFRQFLFLKCKTLAIHLKIPSKVNPFARVTYLYWRAVLSIVSVLLYKVWGWVFIACSFIRLLDDKREGRFMDWTEQPNWQRPSQGLLLPPKIKELGHGTIEKYWRIDSYFSVFNGDPLLKHRWRWWFNLT